MMIEYAVLAVVFAFTVILLRRIFSTQQNFPPGPFPLPIIGHLHLLSPLLHQSLHKLSFQYGPIFRIKLGSVECVVASSPDIAKEFLKTHELNFASRDHHSFAIDYLTYNKSFVFAPYGPYWRFVKKLCMSEVLSSNTLNQFVTIRTKEIHQFLHLLAEKAKSREAINISEALLRLTNNIISEMMLSIRCSGTEDEAGEARKIVREITKMIGSFNLSDLIWFFKRIDLQGYPKKYKDVHTSYDALLDKIIKDREEIRKKRKDEETSGRGGEHRRKDFLDTLLDVLENDSSDIQLNKDHIKALILDFFTAGTDTSAIAMEWALVELINHPRVLEKARIEINEVVGKDKIVSESDISQLPYIQAIVKETLRLHPSIPMIARISREDWKINGYKIPSNTLLLVNAWSISRNPKYWDRPLEFFPERFLERAEGNVDVKGQHFQLLPFGSGRRLCPGMSLAMLELPTFVASVVQCFDLKATNIDGEEIKGDGVLDTSEHPGLTVPRAQDLVCVPIMRISKVDQMLQT